MNAYLWRCSTCGHLSFDERRPPMRYTNHVCRFQRIKHVQLMKGEPDWPRKREMTD